MDENIKWHHNTEKPNPNKRLLISTNKGFMVGFFCEGIFYSAHPGDDRAFPQSKIIAWRYLTEDEEIINNYWEKLY